jgi:hypothetical protein
MSINFSCTPCSPRLLGSGSNQARRIPSAGRSATGAGWRTVLTRSGLACVEPGWRPSRCLELRVNGPTRAAPRRAVSRLDAPREGQRCSHRTCPTPGRRASWHAPTQVINTPTGTPTPRAESFLIFVVPSVPVAASGAAPARLEGRAPRPFAATPPNIRDTLNFEYFDLGFGEGGGYDPGRRYPPSMAVRGAATAGSAAIPGRAGITPRGGAMTIPTPGRP